MIGSPEVVHLIVDDKDPNHLITTVFKEGTLYIRADYVRNLLAAMSGGKGSAEMVKAELWVLNKLYMEATNE